MPLVTIPQLEQYGQVDFLDNSDAAVQLLIDWAVSQAETFCDRTFEREVGISEVLDGSGQRNVWLSKYPVEAVTSVNEDGTVLTAGTQYLLKATTGKLTRMFDGKREWHWTGYRQAITVVYTAGYADGEAFPVPEVLRGTLANIALRRFKAEAAWASTPVGVSGDKQAVNLDGIGSITYATGAGSSRPWDPTAQGNQQSAGSGPDLTPAEKAALTPFRRVTFGGGTRPASRF